MAEYTRKQLDDIVSRVASEITQESGQFEREVFGVEQLKGHVADLGQLGREAAWTISYSTAAEALLERPDVLGRLGAEVAWTISYSTAAEALAAPKTRSRA